MFYLPPYSAHSTLLHSTPTPTLSPQAMVYDVLNIEKDVYKFKQQSMAGSKDREVTLNGKMHKTPC